MRILIAEDELASRAKMIKLLEGLGHETIVAGNGAEAWHLWQKEHPKMLITD